MEETAGPIQSFSSKQKEIPKFLIFIFVFILIVLVAEAGIYFFFLQKKDSSEKVPSVPLGQETGETPEKGFEGPQIFEYSGDSKRLLAIQGVITKIDEDSITITREEEDYFIPRDEIIRITEITVEKEYPVLTERDYEEGMIVSFNPGSGVLVLKLNANEP